jgi:phosphate starvation-inducible membrane PsiE
VGAPGLLLLMMIVLLGLIGTCLAAFKSRQPYPLVFFAVFLAACLFGIADSALILHNNFMTIAFVTIYFKLGVKLPLRAIPGLRRPVQIAGAQTFHRALE